MRERAEGLGGILWLLGVLDVLVVLVVNIRHEGVAHRLLTSDLLVERPLLIRLVCLGVGE